MYSTKYLKTKVNIRLLIKEQKTGYKRPRGLKLVTFATVSLSAQVIPFPLIKVNV